MNEDMLILLGGIAIFLYLAFNQQPSTRSDIQTEAAYDRHVRRNEK